MMRVEAVRDDGALLVTHGGRAAAIISPDGTWLTTVGSALARGYWDEPAPGTIIPNEQRAQLIERLQELDRELGPDLTTGSNTGLEG